MKSLPSTEQAALYRVIPFIKKTSIIIRKVRAITQNTVAQYTMTKNEMTHVANTELEPINPKPSDENPINSLEALVANMCFCKLRTLCPDKNSSECMKHRNIYQEFMQSR